MGERVSSRLVCEDEDSNCNEVPMECALLQTDKERTPILYSTLKALQESTSDNPVAETLRDFQAVHFLAQVARCNYVSSPWPPVQFNFGAGFRFVTALHFQPTLWGKYM